MQTPHNGLESQVGVYGVDGPIGSVGVRQLPQPKTSTIVVNMLGGPGAGKCFAPGTMIVMADGTTKPIEDILPGQYVLGPDSKPKRVLSMHHGWDEMYHVRQAKGAIDYVVNSRHLVTMRRSAGAKNPDGSSRYPTMPDVVHIPAAELSNMSGKFYRTYKGFKAETSWEAVPVPIDPYFLGLWLGDGSASGIGLCTVDAEIEEYIRTYAAQQGLVVREHLKEGTDAKYLHLSGTRYGERVHALLAAFKELGLLDNKHIPHCYMKNSAEVRLQLLAGLLDTDGCMSRNSFSITQKREGLARQIKRLADSLGFKTSITSVQKRIASIGFEGTYWLVHISGNVQRILTRLPRKQARPKNTRNPHQTTLSLTNVGWGEYYGISVEDELMLLEDNTVVHNSTMASHVFALLKWAGIRSELALEYAKTKVWEGSESVLEDQIYLFGKQRHAQFILEDKVSVIVTDSPILLSIVYDQTKNPHLRELVLQQFHRNHNVTVALTRKKKYDKIGRQQTLEQAVEKDVQLRDLLAQEGIPYHELEGVPETAQVIVELVKQKLAELASENDVD